MDRGSSTGAGAGGGTYPRGEGAGGSNSPSVIFAACDVTARKSKAKTKPPKRLPSAIKHLNFVIIAHLLPDYLSKIPTQLN